MGHISFGSIVDGSVGPESKVQKMTDSIPVPHHQRVDTNRQMYAAKHINSFVNLSETSI